jgi:hypothetical protein
MFDRVYHYENKIYVSLRKEYRQSNSINPNTKKKTNHKANFISSEKELKSKLFFAVLSIYICLHELIVSHV